ncbi:MULTISPECIES: GDSL-type esterase/lipase family protein [unclassified Devosia]|uniref:GDSL-type esterase/lipase family protein n=1 Tax=unclassified Devosia TaxID=196773 RepID=UPI00145F3676|nr:MULTISPECIES: GDSL-type esterase/lipase family protein [unclassified Devosia]MBJ6986238.1 arylesterase [Devosia sp. MC521]MBJ7576350.1 arylesterase [Devosia sp. MC532]MBK1793038.1 arylesterase [Devosia sp. WQ 349K1]QMW64278.1 arylesterase [Devosia sp. MC521]
MKTILAFGDSLTYGANPVTGGPRHAYEHRWPTALEQGLGGAARVIAEGMGGRTTVCDDWFAPGDRNGGRILPTLLESHSPLDLVIIMLGTNDLKPAINGSALQASFGIRRLVQIIREHAAGKAIAAPAIIIAAPPHICDTDHADMIGHFGGFAHASSQSQLFAEHYARRAAELNTGFFDASTVAQADPRDGVHLDEANTRAIGLGLVPLVKQTLGL